MGHRRRSREADDLDAEWRPRTVDVEDASCTHSYSVAVDVERDVALADGPIDPLEISATTDLIGEICGTTATPPPTSARTPTPAITRPPTDLGPAPLATTEERLDPALVIGFIAGVLAAAVLLVPRAGARRRC
jgi:hypothetical protein